MGRLHYVLINSAVCKRTFCPPKKRSHLLHEAEAAELARRDTMVGGAAADDTGGTGEATGNRCLNNDLSQPGTRFGHGNTPDGRLYGTNNIFGCHSTRSVLPESAKGSPDIDRNEGPELNGYVSQCYV